MSMFEHITDALSPSGIQSGRQLLSLAYNCPFKNTDQMLQVELFCGCGGLAEAGLEFRFSVSTNRNFVSKSAKNQPRNSWQQGWKAE